ncbi:hypothetical protein GCM10023310_23310 [Paenibacillus vulneris]|uniref:DUF4871 domain-containing protein n=1 Tax=Paenibacillus vulneris TaxID=1133364 RepID=A0ABW3UDY7_9BACL
MDHQKPGWAEEMKASPFAENHFTPELQSQVIQKASLTRRVKPASRVRAVGAALVLVSILACLVWIGKEYGTFPSPASSLGVTSGQEQVRQVYYDKGKLVLEVFPDPELKAGQPYGYIWSFKAPFDELKGKTLSITAEHKKSGLKLTVLPPVEITEPSSGYPGLERFTATFGLPFSGLWHYTAVLDGQAYADVVLSVQEPSWEVSPMFRSGSYDMRGIEHQVGFIDAGFIAGAGQKYMWHFWENREPLEGAFTVKAVKQGEERLIDVFSAASLGGANNGADRTAVSMMSLPEPGLWRLLPYVGDRMLGSIVVRAK